MAELRAHDTLPVHDERHEHRFEPITRWSKSGPPFFQMVVGYRCRCGATPLSDLANRMYDPVQNLITVVRYLERRRTMRLLWR